MADPSFVIGGIYRSTTHGMVEYLGVDVYLGQTSMMFRPLNDRTVIYLLPWCLHRHFDQQGVLPPRRGAA